MLQTMYGLLLSQRSLARFLLQFGSSPRMRFAVYRAALFADCGVPALTFCDTSFCNAEHTASIDFHQPNFFIESFSETYKHYSHRQVESAIAVSELGAWRCRADTDGKFTIGPNANGIPRLGKLHKNAASWFAPQLFSRIYPPYWNPPRHLRAKKCSTK